MMKNFLIKLLLSIAVLNPEPAPAQKFDNVTWTFSVVQKGCDAELTATAVIADGWYIYSQFQPNSDGPIPTTFTFTESGSYKKVGKVEEGKAKVKFMEGFGGEYNIFPHKAVFKQKIKINNKKDFEIKGELEFMQCDESKCLPPAYVPFAFKIKGSDCAGATDVVEPVVENPVVVEADTSTSQSSTVNPVGWKIYSKKFSATEYEIILKAESDSGWVIPAEEIKGKGILPVSVLFGFPKGVTADGELKKPDTEKITSEVFGSFLVYKSGAQFSQKIKVETKDSLALMKLSATIDFVAISGDKKATLSEKVKAEINLHDSENINQDVAAQSYWGIFIIAFLSGFAALLTPCVFPMIPMTVSFFLKSSKNRRKAISNAVIYGISIILIYVVLGLAITLSLGPDALNKMSTSLFFNLIFFTILIVFAISFMGAFEIVLPSKWVNSADKNADRGGLIGIFFMAFVLALVSFSCTGPIVGTLLVDSVSKGIMGPIFGMFGFSLAIALPFTLFAIFPGWLNGLPQSGGWLNTVKVSLGFVEIALAMKFLSKADLVYQMHFIEREVFIAIFIGVFFMWGMYLIGMFKMPHDSEMKSVSPGRAILATVVFAFVFYLLPGMWGAPVNILAGIAPPMEYSESPYGVNGKMPEVEAGELPEHAVYGPHQLVTFHDYETGMQYAREKGIPAMIDFTGYGCENCRKMEQNVWSGPDVLKKLRDSVVVISLHVDERTKLENGDPDFGKFRTVGQKWADLEVKRYGEISQPLYVLLDANEEMLNGKASYQNHGSIPVFKQWLEDGLKTYRKRGKVRVVRPEMLLAVSSI